jgi:hypothetical protein
MMTDSPLSAAPPPGWYADSPNAARVRWWNGSAWTDHYQAATDAVPVVPSPSDEPPPAPMTRAQRRAAEVAPPAGEPPPIKAEPARLEPAPAEPEPVRPEPARTPAPVVERFPDQIVDRGPRAKDDRPPLPVVYRPPQVSHAPSTRSTFIPLPQKNGPATASLVLLLISLLGGAAIWWFDSRDPALADALTLITIAMLAAAFILAIVGLTLAVSRPTKKLSSAAALALSSLLIVGTVVLFTTGVWSVALPLPA